jgi:hypothetical protein
VRAAALIAVTFVACTGTSGIPGGSACSDPTCPADGAADRGQAAGATGSDGSAAGDGSGGTPGLLAEYDFDETAGTVALDSSGGYRNGGLIGAVSWGGMGHQGGDASFRGGYVLLPPSMLDQARELTLMAWVKVRTNDKPWERIFDFGSGTGSYFFLTDRSDTNTTRFAITRGGAAAEQQLEMSMPLPLGVWKHVAVVLGAAGGTLYVDGQSVAASAEITLRPTDIAPITNEWLGKSQFSYDPLFDGELDQVRIYSRALSAAEVAAAASGP